MKYLCDIFVLVVDYVLANVCIVTVHHLTHGCEFIVHLLPQWKIEHNAGHSCYVRDCPFYRVSISFSLINTVHFTASLLFFLSSDCPTYSVSIFFSSVRAANLIMSQFPFP